MYGTVFTVMLALVFTALQGLEYTVSSFTLTDSTYGSCFYFGTGFHGLHVTLGAIILSVVFLRILIKNHFSSERHFAFQAASWYWHFVDVVWLNLFVIVYVL